MAKYPFILGMLERGRGDRSTENYQHMISGNVQDPKMAIRCADLPLHGPKKSKK